MIFSNGSVNMLGVIMVFSSCTWASTPGALAPWRFDFGPGPVEQGYTPCLPETAYLEALGFGFIGDQKSSSVDRGKGTALERDFITSNKPFYFSVKVPEGNYKIMVTLGDAEETSETTLKAELRRLMLEKVVTLPGQIVQRSFIVNIRTPWISGSARVQLKDREKTQEAWAWDDQLILEFNGKRPCVCAMEIVKVNVPTAFILGDSTVCDQPSEPWNSWGQMVTRFFKPTVAIANHAESGESIHSSLGARRFDKVYSLVQPGDTVLVQFGHNDMKSRAENASDIYKTDLKAFVTRVRQLGATPVLITSMERKQGMVEDTLLDYPDKMRQIAAEEKVALIDLHAQSKILYKALGANLDKAFQDGTHHTSYGSYLLAKCVVQGIKDNGLDLARHVVEDFPGFDPTRPDPVERFDIPASPMVSFVRPLGDR